MAKRLHTEPEQNGAQDVGLKKRRVETSEAEAKDRDRDILVSADGILGAEKKTKTKSKKERSEKAKHDEQSRTNAAASSVSVSREESESEFRGNDSRGETRDERKRRKKEKKKRREEEQEEEQKNHDGQIKKQVLNGPEEVVIEHKPHWGSYEQHQTLTALPQTTIDEYLSSKSISIADTGSKAYRPIIDFSQVSPSSKEAKVFDQFSSPTPVQAATWPYLLSGRDVIGIAETGSGKTLAYGVPLVRYVASKQKKGRRGIKALVVSPTRELALQIHEQLEKLVAGTPLKTVCIFGGISKDTQRPALEASNIVVATPGRLNDFIQEGAADLSQVGFIVLDEADRMLEKGFEDDMRKILGTISTPNRQTCMYTATWPPSIRDLAATYMNKPVRVNIGDASGELRANVRVEQRVEVVDPRGKENRLLQLLKQYHTGKGKDDRILVFCLYRKEASRVEGYVRSKGFQVGGIHGDMGQFARMESLEGFRSGKVPLLIATDVAARGLDIPAVKLVVNLTFPLTVEDYVHRIGRTGRAGREGLAITLFTEHDKALSGSLINVLRAAKQPVPEELLKFGTTVKKKTHEAYGAFYKDTSDGPQKKSTKITFDD